MAVSMPGRTKAPGTRSTAPRAAKVQRSCSCGRHAGAKGECTECRKKKLLGRGSVIQHKLVMGRADDPAEREADRMAEWVARSGSSRPGPVSAAVRAAAAPPRAAAPDIVPRVLRSAGSPLPPTVRAQMEERFGRDFGSVRVHTGPLAETSAAAVDALAYTVGSDIVFGRGQYQTNSPTGRNLLAHELTHVVQQGQAPSAARPTAVLQRREDITDTVKLCERLGVPCPSAIFAPDWSGQLTVACRLVACLPAVTSKVPGAISPGTCVYLCNDGRTCTCTLLGTSRHAACVFRICVRPGDEAAMNDEPRGEDLQYPSAQAAHSGDTASEILQTKPGFGRTSAGAPGGLPPSAGPWLHSVPSARPRITASSRDMLQRKGTAPNSLCGGTWSCAASPCADPDPGRLGDGGTPTSWHLKVMIDTEASSAAEMTPDTVGHTYVELSDSTGRAYTYGFYPDKSFGTPDPVLRPVAPGCVVHPDTTHRPCIDYEEAFVLTQPEFEAALSYAQAQCRSPLPYHILTFNCTTFAIEVARRAGKSLPAARDVVGTSMFDIRADNPNTLQEGLERRDVGPTYRLESDTEIRRVLGAADAGTVQRIPVAEKIRVINRLLDGWVSDEDLETIRVVCRNAAPGELQQIRRAIEPRAVTLTDLGQRSTLRMILAGD